MSPLHKYRLQGEIREFLYRKVFNHIEKRILELATRNQEITGSITLAFVYRSETFAQRVVSKGRYIIPKPLDESLRPEMDKILAHRTNIISESDYVMSLMSKVFSMTNKVEEVLGLLPEGIHPPIIKFIGQGCPAPSDLPPEMHQEVLEFNAQGYEMLRTRLMGNLVL
ncbi:hypothetical protein [Acinetobacter sp. A47]|uniref:hypothetical protein n=1 Tax=Acinetobacter sp. A47 TaxID=1561217 RepID=UPI000570743F|nr:hypothetical protein [Acinetobacter sp. A47]